MSVKIMVDSASDITKSEAEKMGIYMVPMEIMFGEEEYLSGVNLMPSEFYSKLSSCQDLPKTSQVNPFMWEQEFDKALKECDELIVVTISSKLSGTYLSAVEAAKKFKNVYIVDSYSAAIGERMLCEYALKLIEKGEKTENIVEELNRVKSKMTVMAMVDTLKYLKKGGRISAAVAIIGGMFSIKPVVAMVDGEVKMIGKAIGSKKAIAFLNSYAESKDIDYDMPLGVIWSGNDEKIAIKFIEEKQCMLTKNCESVKPYILGSTIGTHVGSGALGFAFFEK